MVLTKPAGTWTYDDLFALPDDGKRYEIIEGALYEMPAPHSVHAKVIMNLILLLAPVIARLRGTILTALHDVFFRGADPVQPDILAILPGGLARLAARGTEGPPDLMIEVLSPSNRGHDLLTKRALYGRAGVREYWIVDPVNQTIELLSLTGNALITSQIASHLEPFHSPLLDTTVPTVAVFAGIEEIGN